MSDRDRAGVAAGEGGWGVTLATWPINVTPRRVGIEALSTLMRSGNDAFSKPHQTFHVHTTVLATCHLRLRIHLNDLGVFEDLRFGCPLKCGRATLSIVS